MGKTTNHLKDDMDTIEILTTQLIGEYVNGDEAKLFIQKQVKQAIDKAISSCFSYNAPLTKAIEHAISKSLNLDKDAIINLPSYNDAILKIVERQLEAATKDAIERQVAGRLKELLVPIPERIKLSQLVEEYRKHLQEKYEAGCDCYGEKRFWFKMVDEKTDGFKSIYFSENNPKDSFGTLTYDIRMGWYRDKIYHLTFKKEDIEKKMFVGSLYGFERMLFQMKAAQAIVELDIDQDDVDTTYGSED